MFHSQEESTSNDENSTLQGGAPFSPVDNGSIASLSKPRLYGGRPAESNALLTRRESRKVDVPQKLLQASQKVNRHPDGGCCSPGGGKPRKKTRRRKKRRNFSDRLLAPTITSLAKCGALDHKPKSRRPRAKPLSEQAVCFSDAFTFQALFEEPKMMQCFFTFRIADVGTGILIHGKKFLNSKTCQIWCPTESSMYAALH